MRIVLTLVLLLSCTQLYVHDKWIVVTTINYPTKALKQLANLEGWHLVVVADKKTPLDWHLDNCTFLSVQKQESLGFEITKLLPWNHYSRKNIGYLYAIANRARIIYETDDDNYLLNATAIDHLPVAINNARLVSSNNCVANPYAYFGKQDVWPRGYPLQYITNQQTNFQAISDEVFVPIQQGLVNVDPDVDAIFRLTRKEEVFFDNGSPLIIDKKCMAPFNSQNTLFHYSAFWGLLIPVSVSFRVSDIWRSYWVQRLLWDIGANLCFTEPTANQYRNQHNLLKDFADEYDFYMNAERFIKALINWQSPTSDMQLNILALMKALVAQNFFKQEDAILMQAWLNDLRRCGYIFPQPTKNIVRRAQ